MSQTTDDTTAQSRIVTDPDVDLPEGGKDLEHVVERVDPRPAGPNKQVLEVVTDDDTVYRFSRFPGASDSEAFTWEHRQTPEGETDTARRQLPGVVQALIDEYPEPVTYK